MRLPPRFWTSHDTWMPGPEGRELRLELWGWSDESHEAAAQHARSRVERLAQHLAARGRSEWDEYYPTGPVREPVLASYDAAGAEVAPGTPPEQVRAFLTRTRYGAVVLNTDAVVVVDVDLPDVVAPPAGGLGGRIARFLGFAAEAEPQPEASGEQAALHRIRAWAARHPDLGVRTYRTKAGFRVLVTGTGFGPTDPRTATLLAELGSDPLYARLCAAQQSFRARLTPKPWRVGVLAAGTRWPFRDPSEQQRFERWLPQYEAASQSYSVCSLVESVGQSPSAHEQAVVLVHDVWTGVESPLPLA